MVHFSRSFPQKTTKLTSSPPTATTTTTITEATTITNESPKPEAGDHPNKEEEGWTQVARHKKKNSPLKKQAPIPTPEIQTTKITTATTGTTATTMEKIPVSSLSSKTSKKEKQPEAMDITLNLKRRRESGESLKRKRGKRNIVKSHPKNHPSNNKHNPIHRQKHAPSHNPKKKMTIRKHQFNQREQLKSFHP